MAGGGRRDEQQIGASAFDYPFSGLTHQDWRKPIVGSNFQGNESRPALSIYFANVDTPTFGVLIVMHPY